MSSARFEFNEKAIADLALRGAGVRRLVAQHTDAAANRLAGDVGSDNVDVYVGGNQRARGTIRRLGPGSLADEVEDGALTRALRG